MTDSEDDLLSSFDRLSVEDNRKSKMDAATLQQIVESAVAGALAAQQAIFETKLIQMDKKIENLTVSAPVAAVYEEATVDSTIKCEAGLDGVKSVPEFPGGKAKYLSFRQAAQSSMKVFSGFEGSFKYHDALVIIRNKITGPANDLLTSHKTPLNFKAIIARLDWRYVDKKPLHILENEISLFRQGTLTVDEYYDKVELKLNEIINKVLMTYDGSFAEKLVIKYREDALRVFISGLKRSLSDIIHPAQPKDLPSALALAEEIESNRERYAFAANYSRQVENKDVNKDVPPPRHSTGPSRRDPLLPRANPRYVATSSPPQPPAEPMDVDPSMRAQFSRRTNNSNNYRNKQAINNIAIQENEEENIAYATALQRSFDSEDEDEEEFTDDVNFLGVNPCSRS